MSIIVLRKTDRTIEPRHALVRCVLIISRILRTPQPDSVILLEFIIFTQIAQTGSSNQTAP